MSTPRSRRGQAAQGRAGRAGQAGRAGRAGRASRPRPLPPGDTLFTPDASATRASVEQRSATPLLWLHQLPRWLLPLLAVALLVTGLALTGWAGAIALVALAAVLGWLAVVSWPRLNAQGRALRVLVIAVVLLVAVVRGLHG